VQLLPDGPLPWLARELKGGDALNLLQGEFSRGPDYAERWRQWRTPALLAGALLVAHVGAQALQIHQANKQIAALDAEIAQVYSTAMPSEPMHDPRKQMQSRLDRIRKSSVGPQYFLHSVQAVSAAMAGVPQTTIEAMSYREHTLDLKLSAGNVDALSRVSQAVAKQGLSADIQSSTPLPSGVEAHMQIQPQGAKAHR
jgi:type II secretion system protein L